MDIQKIIVVILIGLSLAYLLKGLIQSVKNKKSKHCSGCGKE